MRHYSQFTNKPSYYIRWPGNNFGDNLNDIIFPSLGVNNSLLYKKHLVITDNCYLGLGSILGSRINKPLTIIGSGIGGGNLPSTFTFQDGFVRGKLTCKVLNISESYALGDTAYFLKTYMQNLASATKKYKYGIIPHWKTKFSKNNENIISPDLPVDDFIRRVSECEFILSEAMHGAICADILRVPFAPVKIGNNFNERKWNDWASVLDIQLSFGNLTNYELTLSDDKKLNNTYENIKNYLENKFA